MTDRALKALTLCLPVPPSGNRFYRIFRGRAVMSAEGRDYKRMVAQLAVAKRLHPATGPVSLDVVWYRAAKRGDLDNRIKIVCDALQGALYVNDAQIVELRIRRHEDKTDPRMLVTVGPVDVESVPCPPMARQRFPKALRAPNCAWVGCGRPLPVGERQRGTGRRFCSRGCRWKAWSAEHPRGRRAA